MTWQLIFFGLVLPAGIAYSIGRGRDRGGLGLLLGLLLSWIGVVIALFLTTGGMDCPLCREKIKHDAQVCKHCGATIETEEGWWKTTVKATPPTR